ncbi:AraC family transcriptional regulator [Paenibacillus yonginensis]|uniref:AraC family transcriptional regulator n=1 Tax=Paenibacillus yonginensis TaxID=1462996 RepID=A0A1B1MXJ4_9BACL|nr:response regulator [Paenibacillus yonginensis]ANS73869.1 AraC family transcriptional regulator [Paenibacillus yonginensis]
MYQVLLVDDEPLVHHHLRSLSDWRNQGFGLCGEAYEGEEALRMMDQLRPHIVILDVNMQGMNGVELNRAIRERYPSVKTIMLSSYDDYDYVRECLKNGAVDYLLKHRLDAEQLLGVLRKAVREMEKDQDGQMRNFGSPSEFRELLAQTMRGRPGAVKELEDYARESGRLQGVVCYTAAAMQISSFLLLAESRSDVQTSRMVQQAIALMQQTLGDQPERTVTYVENGRIAVLFAFKDRSEQAAASEAERLMSHLRHSLELFLNLKCTYAIGHVCSSLSKLEASYRAAEQVLDASRPLTMEGVFSERVSLTIEEQKQILLSVENLDRGGVREAIASAFEGLRQQPVHAQAVQMIVRELLSIGEKAARKWVPFAGGDQAGSAFSAREDLGRIDSVAGLEQWLYSYYEELLDRLKRERAAGPHSRHVSQAILLILEKYPSYITLELAAGAIGLHPSYLSRIFKEETGMTFSEYVNRVRIDASRKLLESGRYSVKQVSVQVGFSTYNYFFKVFKEWTGMTPQAYVQKIKPPHSVK